MANFQDVFKRYEKKYLLTPQQYACLRESLKPLTEPDAYGQYTVRNLYFDTESYALIRASIDKPLYKEKLRLRSYVAPKADSAVFLEIKKKYDGVVYKRRASMTLAQSLAYLSSGIRAQPESQILREIDWFLTFWKPAPKVFIAYDRAALCSKETAGLRVTFDSHIRWRSTALDLTQGDWGSELLSPGTVLMEIKIPGVMPLWLSRLLSELAIFPTSFSKYGTCYQQHLAHEQQWTGGIICA